MAKLISLPTFSDKRGDLTVIEKILPFTIKRVYFIYNSEGKSRGFHKHKKTSQALVAINGSCSVNIVSPSGDIRFNLDNPSKCLILNPEDYHWMDNFNKGTVLLVLASHYYDKRDYIENGVR